MNQVPDKHKPIQKGSFQQIISDKTMQCAKNSHQPTKLNSIFMLSWHSYNDVQLHKGRD